MHIVMAADRRAGIGGIETHMATLAEELCRIGQKVTLLFPRIDEPALFARAVGAGTRLVAAPLAAWQEFLEREAVDLFHAHSAGATRFAAETKLDRRLPTIVTVHGPEQSTTGIGARMGAIYVSEEIAAKHRAARHPSVTIENGIDLGYFRPPERRVRSPFRIVYLGRVGPGKEAGICALKEALRAQPGVALRVASDWLPREAVQSARTGPEWQSSVPGRMSLHHATDPHAPGSASEPKGSQSASGHIGGTSTSCRNGAATPWGKQGPVRLSGRPVVDTAPLLQGADLVFSTGRGIREAMACGAAACVLGVKWDGLVTPESVERLKWHNFSGRALRHTPHPDTIRLTVRSLVAQPRRLWALKAFGPEYAARHWDARTMGRRTYRFYLDVAARLHGP